MGAPLALISQAAQRLKGWWPWALLAGSLGLMYGPSLSRHIRRGSDPRIFGDDARQQIYPFFRYADSSLFPSDYVADYYLDCLPLGFRAFYTLSAPLVDPVTSNKIVMYLMLLITVVALGAAANRLGGKVAAWGAMALVLGGSVYLERMGGGLPRAFGFPILACALVALSCGHTKWLAALVWLGACFYPVAGVLVGMAMTFVLLLLPATDRGDARDWGLAPSALPCDRCGGFGRSVVSHGCGFVEVRGRRLARAHWAELSSNTCW
jgi:hypothetical protein